MNITRLFIANLPKRAPAPPGAPRMAPPNAAAATPVFITPESLASFAGASAAVLALQWLFGPRYSIAALALVGIAMFLVNISEPATRPNTLVKWLIAVVVAIINTAVLGATAAGVASAKSTTTSPAPAASVTPATGASSTPPTASPK